jgi:hypothetical protein
MLPPTLYEVVDYVATAADRCGLSEEQKAELLAVFVEIWLANAGVRQ